MKLYYIKLIFDKIHKNDYNKYNGRFRKPNVSNI